MNDTDCRHLKTRAEAEYKKAVDLAKARLDETLEAIEKVSDLLKLSDNDTEIVKPNEVDTKPPQSYGSLTVNVKKAIASVIGTFDKNDIISALGDTPNESSFDGCLRRLVKKGIIKVDVQGSGRRATRYKRVKKYDMFQL